VCGPKPRDSWLSWQTDEDVLRSALAGTRFLFLDERDARTLTALRTTPLSMRQYLAYRVALPLLLGTASTLIGDPLTELTPLPMSTQLPIAIVAGVPHRSWQCACCRCAEQGCGVRCGESHERGEPSAGPRGSAPGSVRCRNFPKVLADARAVVGSGRRTLRCISRNRHSGFRIVALAGRSALDRRLLRRG
jgi:hypothetical protein